MLKSDPGLGFPNGSLSQAKTGSPPGSTATLGSVWFSEVLAGDTTIAPDSMTDPSGLSRMASMAFCSSGPEEEDLTHAIVANPWESMAATGES